MKKSLKLIVISTSLLFLFIATNVTAQITNTTQGIIVSVNGKYIELAVAKNAAFRLSTKYSGTPTAISSISIDETNQQLADFTVVSQNPVYGIQTAYGKLLVNVSTKKWMLYDDAGVLIISNGTFTSNATEQIINDGEKGISTLYGSGNSGTKELIKVRSNTNMGNGYAGVPYFWSTLGYSALGVTTDDNVPAQWTKNNTSINWQFNGAAADLYIWPAKTQYDGLKVLSQLVGQSTIPPKWAFGFLQSRWGWESPAYIQNTLTEFNTRKLPVDAFIYDFEWYTKTPDYTLPKTGAADFSDFNFNPALFNDAENQIASYKSQGVKMMGIRKPRLGNTANLENARENGWLKYPNSTNPDNSRDLDFTKESLRSWYIEQTRPLVKAGVDGWWNDEGESYYSLYYWWNKTQSDLLQSEKPNTRNFSINRAFSQGTQRFGFCTWNGDIDSNWASLQRTTADLLNWSLAGMSYGSCDLGGFFGTPDNEAIVRWYQTAVFFPIMKAHSHIDARPRFPWLYGTESEAAIKKALNFRYQLLPYIYSLGHEAYNNGAPIMRPLVMEFPNDSNVANLKDEWLLGKGLLAAPILYAGGKRTVYLPKDIWYDFNKNTVIQGPASINVTAALNEIPLYVRAGTILPIGPVVQHAEQDTIAPLEIRIFPGKDGSFTMTEDDGKTNDYTQNIARTTLYSWNEESKTLSWKVSGSFSNSHVYQTINVILGTETQTATIGTEGSLVFTGIQLPFFSPEPGMYENSPLLSITAPATGTIYYTLDGTIPTKQSAVYTEPFNLPDRYRVTVNAFISKDGKDYPVSSAVYFQESCQGEGVILLEKWNGLSGSSVDVASIPVNTPPSVSSYLTDVLEIQANSVQNYGARVSGTLTVPETGNYTFYIAGDDNVQLRLGTDSNPSSLTRIAYINGTGWTDSRVWDKYPSQKSALIPLVKCQTYSIEALLKQYSHGSNMAVRWVTPSGLDEVIPCKWLSTTTGDACTINKSLRKTATASGQVNDNESAAGAVDGNNSSKWCSVNAGNKWLEVDLGSDVEICRWYVLHGGSESSSYITGDFRLQKKVGENWVDVDVVTGNVENETDRAVAPFKARYVRLYVTKAEQNNANGATRIYEFSVFGSNNETTSSFTLTEDNDDICLYPNPTKESIVLEIKKNELLDGKVDVINIDGKIVKTFAIKSNKQILNISSLNPGVYYFRVYSNGSLPVVKKIVKV